jgi:hypothetical protein
MILKVLGSLKKSLGSFCCFLFVIDLFVESEGVGRPDAPGIHGSSPSAESGKPRRSIIAWT